MSKLIRKTSFTGGEINQALVKRSNLVKVVTGLKTARNMLVGKDGRLVNRTGTRNTIAAKSNTGNYLYIEVPNTDYLVEVTNLNIRRINMLTGSVINTTSDITDADIPSIDWCISSKYVGDLGFTEREINAKCVVFFKKGSPIRIYDIDGVNAGVYGEAYYGIGTEKSWDASWGLVATGAPSGPEVEYVYTIVGLADRETLAIPLAVASPDLPIAAGQYNTITLTSDGGVLEAPLEYRWFRRQKDGGAYGYIGSSYGTGILPVVTKFVDYGQAADYTISPPLYVKSDVDQIEALAPKTGEMVQGRLLLGNTSDNSENLYASRTNHPFSFTRDFPLSDTSALLFKSGQSGAAEILKITDAGTLVVFTSVGIYSTLTRGALTYQNSILGYVGSAIINEKLKPVKMNDVTLFVDITDNSIKILDFSNNRQNYNSEDITVYSGHLFQGKTITSWAVQRYGDPILWAVMSDGTVTCFTFNDSQELRAWTRCDFRGATVKFVTSAGIGAGHRIIFMVERNGVRTIETLTPRYGLTDKELCFLDASVYKNNPLHTVLGTTLEAAGFTFSTVGPDLWEGDVRLNSLVPVFTSAMIGEIYRQFDSTGSAIDYKCTSVPATTQAIFTKNPEKPYDEVSESFRTNIVLYETFTTVTGLAHLEGQNVGVYSDGAVVASPLNDIENLPNITVLGGQVTIPRAAFCTVGIPYAYDTGTNQINSDDPKVTLAAKTITKAAIDSNQSKGFYVGPEFPANDSLIGMQEPDLVKIDNPTNAALPASTETLEATIENDWKSKGQICIRGVDPVQFELTSIIAYVTFS